MYMLHDGLYEQVINKGDRVLQGDINSSKNNIIQYKVDYSYSSLAWAICEICNLLGVKKTPAVNIEKDRLEIYTRYVNSMKSSSLR